MLPSLLVFFDTVLNIQDSICLPLAEGKPIPTELRYEAAALGKEVELEDENTAGNVPCTIHPFRFAAPKRFEVMIMLIDSVFIDLALVIGSVRCECPINNLLPERIVDVGPV